LVKVGMLTANNRVEYDSEDTSELLRFAKLGATIETEFRDSEGCPMQTTLINADIDIDIDGTFCDNYCAISKTCEKYEP